MAITNAAQWLEDMLQVSSRLEDAPLRLEIETLARQAVAAHLRAVEELQAKVANEKRGPRNRSASVYRYESVLWTKSSGGRIQGPYCTECLESDGTLIRAETCMESTASEGVQRELWRCPECSSSFDVVDKPMGEMLVDQVVAESNY